jgi:hypothetical protein
MHAALMDMCMEEMTHLAQVATLMIAGGFDATATNACRIGGACH